MIPFLRALVIALFMASASPSLAQPSPTSPSSSGAPSVQGAPIADSEKAQSKQDHKAPSAKMPVLNTPKADENHQTGGRGADDSDRVRADEDAHGRNETIIANFTIALAAATVLLMVATGMLWWETRKLAVQAKGASEDTKRSIEIAEGAAAQTARAAQAAVDAVGAGRAWMTSGGFEHATFDNAQTPNGPVGPGMAIAIKWQNTGRSPAVDAQIFRDFKILRGDCEVPTFAHSIDSTLKNNTLPLGVGMDVAGQYSYFHDADYQDFIARKCRILLYSRIQYRSVFSEDTYYSEFCAELHYNGVRLDKNTGHSGPNLNLSPVGNQSGVGIV